MINRFLRRRKPLSRFLKRKPQVRIGKVTGKVRLSGAALEQLRERRYQIDQGRCTWPLCGVWLPLYGSVFNRAHLAHVVSRGAGGSDTIENTRIRCYTHHIEFEHIKGLKPKEIEG